MTPRRYALSARAQAKISSGLLLGSSLIWIVSGGPSVALEATAGERIAECAKRADEERLECYDEMAIALGYPPLKRPDAGEPAPAGLVAAPVEPKDGDGHGKWRVHRSTNPLDDGDTVLLRLEADSGRSGFESRPVTLLARCRSNETEVYVDWHVFLGDDSADIYSDWKYVTVRIGDGKAERQRWSVSTDNEATFAPDWAGNLLKRMLGEERLVLQVIPYSENPVTAVFDVRGLSVALAPLAETCGWDY